MLKLKEIKSKVQFAQQSWSEIEGEIAKNSLFPVKGNIQIKKERLKNLLEDIRSDIDGYLSCSNCCEFLKDCKDFLEKILAISENLRVSYVSPGYVESYAIFDTLRLTNHLCKC